MQEIRNERMRGRRRRDLEVSRVRESDKQIIKGFRDEGLEEGSGGGDLKMFSDSRPPLYQNFTGSAERGMTVGQERSYFTHPYREEDNSMPEWLKKQPEVGGVLISLCSPRGNT